MDEDFAEDSALKRGPVSTSDAIKGRKKRKLWQKEKLLDSLEKAAAGRSAAERARSATAKTTPVSAAETKNGAPRSLTLSLAVPGSILENAQTPELRSYVAGHVARAAAVFSVDEVIVFDDQGKIDSSGQEKSTSSVQMARILQYLECPQYLRKHFFPLHKDLEFAGILNPTDMPHHLRASEESPFREGVVLDRPPTKRGSLVNVGLKKEAIVDRVLTPGLRVTVRLDEFQSGSKLYGSVVSPTLPKTERGLYWGYSVRLASSISTVFSQGPYEYDLTIGTSERGSSVDETEVDLSAVEHVLLVFGGVRGLEAAVEADDNFEDTDPEPLFDVYLNTCPKQGSRTIRTEEAVWVSLAALRPLLKRS